MTWPPVVGSLPIGAVPAYVEPRNGDTFRDAFRTELDAVIAAADPDIEWARFDALNTESQPDALTGYFELEFLGGDESQYTFGAPGANLHRELGTVAVHALVPMARGKSMRDTAERYLGQIRSGFRSRRFAAGSVEIRIVGTAPMGGGQIEGGMWAETLVLAYEVFNVG